MELLHSYSNPNLIDSFFQIRSVCLALAVSCMWIIMFGLGLILPKFLSAFSLSTFMFTLGGMSLLNALFAIFCTPETRGKSFQQITEMLSR